MSSTIKRTLAEPGGGKRRAPRARTASIGRRTQGEAPRISTIPSTTGKLTWTNRRKARAFRSQSGTSRAAAPSATTNQASQ